MNSISGSVCWILLYELEYENATLSFITGGNITITILFLLIMEKNAKLIALAGVKRRL